MRSVRLVCGCIMQCVDNGINWLDQSFCRAYTKSCARRRGPPRNSTVQHLCIVIKIEVGDQLRSRCKFLRCRTSMRGPPTLHLAQSKVLAPRKEPFVAQNPTPRSPRRLPKGTQRARNSVYTKILFTFKGWMRKMTPGKFQGGKMIPRCGLCATTSILA